jgi:hypothetical protein
MSAVETGDQILASTAALLTPFHPLLPEQGVDSLLLGLLPGMVIKLRI